MRLNYNDMLLLAIWEYNRRQDEDLTLELFQETFGQVPGAHFHDKWVHYYNKNLLMSVAWAALAVIAASCCFTAASKSL